MVDFRERIRINGTMIPQQYVVDFVKDERSFFEPLHPSFFELTTAMALKYFSDEKVDVAIIEVGLGGRLDCTNIITPCLSIITNISLDHTQFLGNTLAQIASEKAGIIKKGIPIVIGEANEETRPVFEQRASEMGAPIYFAEDEPHIISSSLNSAGLRQYSTSNGNILIGQLAGECQIKNTNTLLCAYTLLRPMFHLTLDDMQYALLHVCDATGLQGRWQVIKQYPTIVCDTGHNTGGWQYLSHQLHQAATKYEQLHIVFGMASDKDIEHVMQQLPAQAHFYWTRASVHRAMDEHNIANIGMRYNLHGQLYDNVPDAFDAACQQANNHDFIYVGGSSFVVADLLKYLQSTD